MGSGQAQRWTEWKNRAVDQMVRLEILKLSRMWDKKPGVAGWWERIKARPLYEAAITRWLRPQDIERYEKLGDPWLDVSKNLAAEAATH